MRHSREAPIEALTIPISAAMDSAAGLYSARRVSAKAT